MKNMCKFFKVLALIPLLFISSCSTDKPAPSERKEQFYYGKSGIVKLIRISRTQSIKEIAYNYGVETEVLARVNGRPVCGSVAAGEVIKIPMSRDVQFEEQVFDEEGQDYDYTIEGIPLVPEPTKQKSPSSDEELDKDINSSKTHVLAEQSLPQGELIISKKEVVKKGDFKYATPLNSKQFIWPVEGKIMSRYGKSGNSFNEGMNIAAPLGTVVRAAADGEVMYVGKEPKVYGNLIIIKHRGNYLTAYAHNAKISVAKGAKVKQGQPIATIGKTGATTIPQLHFSMRKDKKTINPEG
ncbi:MAG: Putative lipoprotein [Candidatus Midichloria mitochondrii]|uniref:Putative lipoprotein n=1 Tax=Midichloria mitochondrii (strain IricVA) TaxID=696127 RepID=F7XV95_MIDMI|nr:M23 family metallopeptidase [Candidatus Midichloria mitochondrii]AEI88594.1 putative lipoprotein [Candidatus Midichloria mitochondrii IricVA]MDJ1256399.1 M23 family metallopeptidase [Candidatus Midichloria mitochondrii]MDJ1288091.1 M23 family metallopeptidase [Candidatus Midichloria mitochondrii]MDJ1298943.1 M23 family metallopeptidase [Candidatus Midichloria mitochondrii]MDJ1313135.1 M23 family metallopeptidase [Candidatus Midichloria mitochondrii]